MGEKYTLSFCSLQLKQIKKRFVWFDINLREINHLKVDKLRQDEKSLVRECL